MTVWPQSPKITSTPRRSRYSVSRYDAMRVSAGAATRSAAGSRTVLMNVVPANQTVIALL